MKIPLLFSNRRCINSSLYTLLFTIILYSSTLLANAQNVVSGTVTSLTDGEPLIGASIVVKGTSIGTTTNFDGNYSIQAEQGQTLVFSYVGFSTQEISVGAQRVINVQLSENLDVLDEVVVIGYGVQKKKLSTGATVQVKGDDLQKLNTISPLQALQGRTPGVNITSTSGQPGSGMKVTIRGLGTIGNSGPLYIIDGIEGDISILNAADIESIDVLKDAASAAIYGAQAANGVVLVTTNKDLKAKARSLLTLIPAFKTLPVKLRC